MLALACSSYSLPLTLYSGCHCTNSGYDASRLATRLLALESRLFQDAVMGLAKPRRSGFANFNGAPVKRAIIMDLTSHGTGVSVSLDVPSSTPPEVHDIKATLNQDSGKGRLARKLVKMGEELVGIALGKMRRPRRYQFFYSDGGDDGDVVSGPGGIISTVCGVLR
ncbi:hypothetical protein DL96DRAFT_1608069 [Flagelloscypha sp. PMI_526]|nr:hypothetical protein DL96DRAFT_1608069 [Flagelloscypha sp. PMI_526]